MCERRQPGVGPLAKPDISVVHKGRVGPLAGLLPNTVVRNMVDLDQIDRDIAFIDRVTRLLQDRHQRGYASGCRDGWNGSEYAPRGRTPEYRSGYHIGYEDGSGDRFRRAAKRA